MRLAHGTRWLAAIPAMILAGLVLFASSSCNSKPAGSQDAASAPPPASSAAGPGFDGGNYCVQTFIQNAPPPQALHFSNKVVESDPSLKTKDYEADLSGDTLDIVYHERWKASDEDRKFIEESRSFTDPKVITRSITNGIAESTITNHYKRSDDSGWRMGSTGLVQGGTPWNLFVSKPTVNRAGAETVNGYDTIKYTVDTTHDSPAEKAGLLMAYRSLKDYNITGTVWVLKDANCVLQYSMDFERISQDGSVSKTHYEGAVTKK